PSCPGSSPSPPPPEAEYFRDSTLAHATNPRPSSAPTITNASLFVALRSGFPADLDQTAIEMADGPPIRYSWRDIDRATAMLANLFESLQLPSGARIAVQTEKSVEGLLVYLAVIRAGFVYLPLNSAYQAAELEY